MKFEELLKKYLGEEDKDQNIEKLLADMKANKLYLANEENIDTRYSKLKEQFDGVSKEYGEAKKLIEELKKSTADDGNLQGKIGEYESLVEKLQTENDALRLDNTIKIELLGAKAKASDLDYLMFKLKQDDITIDKDGKLKGFDLEAVKKAYPSNFEESSGKEVNVNELPDMTANNGVTKEEFDKMGYLARNKLATDNPDLYKELTK